MAVSQEHDAVEKHRAEDEKLKVEVVLQLREHFIKLILVCSLLNHASEVSFALLLSDYLVKSLVFYHLSICFQVSGFPLEKVHFAYFGHLLFAFERDKRKQISRFVRSSAA